MRVAGLIPFVAFPSALPGVGFSVIPPGLAIGSPAFNLLRQGDCCINQGIFKKREQSAWGASSGADIHFPSAVAFTAVEYSARPGSSATLPSNAGTWLQAFVPSMGPVWGPRGYGGYGPSPYDQEPPAYNQGPSSPGYHAPKPGPWEQGPYADPGSSYPPSTGYPAPIVYDQYGGYGRPPGRADMPLPNPYEDYQGVKRTTPLPEEPSGGGNGQNGGPRQGGYPPRSYDYTKAAPDRPSYGADGQQQYHYGSSKPAPTPAPQPYYPQYNYSAPSYGNNGYNSSYGQNSSSKYDDTGSPGSEESSYGYILPPVDGPQQSDTAYQQPGYQPPGPAEGPRYLPVDKYPYTQAPYGGYMPYTPPYSESHEEYGDGSDGPLYGGQQQPQYNMQPVLPPKQSPWVIPQPPQNSTEEYDDDFSDDDQHDDFRGTDDSIDGSGGEDAGYGDAGDSTGYDGQSDWFPNYTDGKLKQPTQYDIHGGFVLAPGRVGNGGQMAQISQVLAQKQAQLLAAAGAKGHNPAVASKAGSVAKGSPQQQAASARTHQQQQSPILQQQLLDEQQRLQLEQEQQEQQMLQFQKVQLAKQQELLQEQLVKMQQQQQQPQVPPTAAAPMASITPHPQKGNILPSSGLQDVAGSTDSATGTPFVQQVQQLLQGLGLQKGPKSVKQRQEAEADGSGPSAAADMTPHQLAKAVKHAAKQSLHAERHASPGQPAEPRQADEQYAYYDDYDAAGTAAPASHVVAYKEPKSRKHQRHARAVGEVLPAGLNQTVLKEARPSDAGGIV